jgi:lipid A 4'-phosphatase
LGALVWTFFRKTVVLFLGGKEWLFLLLALLVGPGLMANVLFKDEWGRARPKTVQEFGGDKQFTRAFAFSDACKRNCSFVSGDAAFGFFLPSFAFVIPYRRSRRIFWGGMVLGGVFSAGRILLGAHFLSDVLSALFLVLGVSTLLHVVFYGRGKTISLWKEWVGLKV